MWTKKFWLDAFERAIKTGAQIVAVGWPASATILDGTNWELLGTTALGAMGLSLLMSVAGTRVGNPESASLLPASEEP